MKIKHIIHLDMDAFYPSVEVLDNPSLKGKPVIVGGTGNRGVVSSASYEARTFGIHSAQPIATARRLCPHGVFLPVRMSRYHEVSSRILEIFHRFTPLVEPLSIDEAFLDVTGSIRLFGPPKQIAQTIKKTVLMETGLTVSAGIAPTKLMAKIASDMEKPDGLTVVPPDGVPEFIAPLSIDRLWGVGKATRKALGLLGVKTIGDLSRLPPDMLRKKFGKTGEHLYLLSRGIDDRDVETGRDMKSIGNEETFEKDILCTESAKRELLALAEKVARRLRRHGCSGRTVTLKVKYHDFVQKTRSVTLDTPLNDGTKLYRICCSLLEKTDVGKKPARLLGIAVSQLSRGPGNRQLLLFNTEDVSAKKKKLNTALDKIQQRFGDRSIQPATLLQKDKKKP